MSRRSSSRIKEGVDVISSPEFWKALADNKVIFIGWREIQRLMRH
jgi:hypothetical protein